MSPAPAFQNLIRRVVILGGGSAGFIGAVTLKRKLPQLEVEVVRSPDLGIIGVGEGTTAAFPRHFFEYLGYSPQQFYQEAEPTWKLGLRFLWGPRDVFYYTFLKEFEKREAGLQRNVGFYCEDDCSTVGPCSALMKHGKAFPKRKDGLPGIHNSHAFHIENRKLVAFLEKLARSEGVAIRDATVREVRTAGEWVTSLVIEDGAEITADLFVDASGFRSELLGRALGEPFVSYDQTLFCDRAVIGGWERSSEPILPYTTCETMESGWAWQIEHEHFINRGYVYSSRFIDDDAAAAELLRKNPNIPAANTRVVRFRTGRTARGWVGNVVGLGNSTGFVEPLEATALQVICVEASTLADTLIDSECQPGPRLIALYNHFNAGQWDEIRDFLAVHYRFNSRLETPFWKTCRHETALGEAQGVVDFYQENGPSVVAGSVLLRQTNSFGIDGYLALLVGQKVPHSKPYATPETERLRWQHRCAQLDSIARQGLTVRECLGIVRQPGFRWGAPSR